MLSPYVPTYPGNVYAFPNRPRIPPPLPPCKGPERGDGPGDDWPWWLAAALVFCVLYASAWVLLIWAMS